jgi:precorrin-6Y C5,15-methyltransferase (decarboxylating)
MAKVQIIGMGDDGLEGLTVAARHLIDNAQWLLGTDRSLSAVAERAGVERYEIGGDLDATVRRITEAGDRRVVILASGDPLFYGTARYLCDQLGKDRFEVVPHVSSMQLAFARVKESWDEAYLTNLATQTLDLAVEKIRTAQKVGLFPTEQATPRRVAKTLLERRIDYFSVYVCENLGAPDECVTQGELTDVATMDFSPMSVMILVRKPNLPDRPRQMMGRRLFGNPDELFLHAQPKRGLITPAEVRSVALAELDLGPTSIVWDVGAGSGSVAIEAAQIAAGGTVYAIEVDPEDYELIAVNAERFGVTNLIRVLGKAPEVWATLPAPDAVFVGGTGRQVRAIVESAFDRLRPGGRLVANVTSIESVAEVHRALHDKSGDADVWMINLARGVYQLEQIRFESLNPTFLIGARKKGGSL